MNSLQATKTQTQNDRAECTETLPTDQTIAQSVAEYTWAVRDSKMSTRAKALCWALASRGTPERAWSADLRADTGLSPRTLVRAKAEAVEAGFLCQTRSGRGGNAELVDEFQLTIPGKVPQWHIEPESERSKCQTDQVKVPNVQGQSATVAQQDKEEDKEEDNDVDSQNQDQSQGPRSLTAPAAQEAHDRAREIWQTRLPGASSPDGDQDVPLIFSPASLDDDQLINGPVKVRPDDGRRLRRGREFRRFVTQAEAARLLLPAASARNYPGSERRSS